MTSRELQQHLLGWKPVFGTLIVLSSCYWLDVIRGFCMEFVSVDGEYIVLV